MKKVLIILSVLLATAGVTFAQTYVELVPMGGYTFADRINYYNAYAKIDGAANIGGSMIFNVNRLFGLELMYQHMNTTSGTYQYGYPTDQLSKGNLAMDYIMFGPVQTFNIPGSPVRPFIGAMLGASILSPGVDGYSNDTKFAWGAQIGTNIYFNPWIGLRLKAQLLAPVDGSGAGFYAGEGGGNITTSGYSGIYQFNLNAGLVIGLGRVLPELRPRPRVYHSRPRYRYRYAPYPNY
ncbi:MAG: hypothetical protein JST96_17885 [Bacteroidetes bacterium]|nr:hypothetical protein [Bacteroidota bacterium]